MASSSPRRTKKRGEHASRSSSRSSSSSGWSARYEENSDREMKRNSAYTSSASSPLTEPKENSFSTSPYEMISIAELNADLEKMDGRKGGSREAATRRSRKGSDEAVERRGRRGSREAVTRRGSDESTDSSSSSYYSSASSPKYVDLSSRSTSYDDSTASDETTTTPIIDSVVFDTAEELECYQRIFIGDRDRGRDAPEAARRARSATSIANSVRNSERHYIGVRSRRSVDKKLTPGNFFMYHDKPSGIDMPVSIELKIAYMSSTSKIYHFPIQRFECQGEPYYVVMQTDTDVKMFPSIATLVEHYTANSLEDPPTSFRLETA